MLYLRKEIVKVMRWAVLLAVFIVCFGTANIVEAGNVNITTKYTISGGIKGPLNSTDGNVVNGVSICPIVPTAGCDFLDDPGYNNNGTVEDSSDDFYTGDLIVRTNDVFEVTAAWSWNGDADQDTETATIVGVLPASGEYEWTDIPGSCDASGSSLSDDRLTMTCVRSNFDNSQVGTVAEDLPFNVRVKGGALDGSQPGDIQFTVSVDDGSIPKTDDTDGTSLTVTAAPRWNLQKSIYTAIPGKEHDGENGYIVDYKFYIETDEVNGEIDNVFSVLGNESMGSSATFNFIDKIDELSPNATLIGCSMDGRYTNRDGYVGSADPVTKSDGIYSQFADRTIPQAGGEQQITCTQNGTDIAVAVSNIDATLNNYPTKSYNGYDLPVNRAIAAIGSIYIFVPLSDVEKGPDGLSGTDDDGELPIKNKLRGFDPTSPTGNSNFGASSESLKDNDYTMTLYGMRGSFSKYYRGEKTSVWEYPGGATTARSGDGLVTAGSEFSTVLVNSNTGGTGYTEKMCDVVDAYRLNVQDVEDNQQYNILKTYYADAYRDLTSPVMYRIWNGLDAYNNLLADSPYIIEYASTYEDNSWLPSRGGDQTVSHKTEIENECNKEGIWFATADEARADTSGVGAVTKVRITLKNGVLHNSGAYSYIWLNHKVRMNDLLTGQPLVNGDEIVNYSAYAFNDGDFIGANYIPNEYPEGTSGTNGDRMTFTGGKVRIEKTADKTAVAPGNIVTFTLDYSYTNDTDLVESSNVIIKDVLPKGFDYVPNSTSGANEPISGTCSDIDASVPCDDTQNKVLIWNLGTTFANGTPSPIVYQTKIRSSAPSGGFLNITTIEAPSDASSITQRKSDVGLTISVPATLNIVKSTVDVGKREFTTSGQDIDYVIDLRNGKPGELQDLDVIDILPFVGDGADGAIKFNAINLKRVLATDYHGTSEFVSMNVLQSQDSTSLCDVTAGGGVRYFYTNVSPTSINMAPTVGQENIIGGTQSIWQEGTASTTPLSMQKSDVTAIRIVGPSLARDAICQLKIKTRINNNLSNDLYTNSAGASATGITLPVLSNSVSEIIVGSSISNKVWVDANADGMQDISEAGLAGVTVRLLDEDGNAVNNPVTGLPYIVQTDTSGEYIFDGLKHGNYIIKFDLPVTYFASIQDNGEDDTIDSDINFTGQTGLINLGVDEDITNVDAGVYQKVKIGNNIWLDINADGIQDISEVGLAGVTVRLLDENGNAVNNPATGLPYIVQTDTSGEYIFDGLTPGTYSVNIVNQDGYSLSRVQSGDNTESDSNFDIVTGNSSLITLTSGQEDMSIDGGMFQSVNLGDFVWIDENTNGVQDVGEGGLAGVVVRLLDINGSAVNNPINGEAYEVTTDGDGKYLFEDIPTSSYVVAFDVPNMYVISAKKAGGDITKDSDINTQTKKTDVIILTPNNDNLNVDVGVFVPAGLGDEVWEDVNGNGIQDGGEAGIAGVKVILLNANSDIVMNPSNPLEPYEVITDADGNYLFQDIPAGDYIVEFVKPIGYQYSQVLIGGDMAIDSNANIVTGKTSLITIVSGEVKTDVDAGFYKPAKIAGLVWSDDNKDGIRAVNENGVVAGITVHLLDENGEVVNNPITGQPYIAITDIEGKYSFENLVAGNYQIKFDIVGYDISPTDVGDDESDSDIDISTKKTALITLLLGDESINNDSGVKKIIVRRSSSGRRQIKDVSTKTEKEAQQIVNDDVLAKDEVKDIVKKVVKSYQTKTKKIERTENGVCKRAIKSDIVFGKENDYEDVVALQEYLNKYEGSKLAITGIYDAATFNAIKRYQNKYTKEILDPWRMDTANGVVMSTTRGHINKMVNKDCFPVAHDCPYFTKSLALGDRGLEVKKVQNFLKDLGFFKGGVDGIFDANTRNAVRSFQNENAQDVLVPWGIPCQCGTGYWYKSTVTYANKLMGCNYEMPNLDDKSDAIRQCINNHL